MNKDSVDKVEKGDGRSLAQFFFDIGFGSCWAEALVKGDYKAPFELSDDVVQRAWDIAPSCQDTLEDCEEFDRRKALSDAAPELLEVLRACRDQFDFYANEHRKAEKHDKAATNERYAFLASQAIQRATGGAS